MGFTHLHLHTEYSLLDGAARIKRVVAKAKEEGMTSIAITDHGVMFGVIDFYKECKKQGIKPIIGCEVYTANTTRFSKDPDKDKYQGHLVLLAKNMEGYKNLIKIVSAGFTEGFYYKPRIDRELLREHSKGIIGLSACLAGEVPQRLLVKDYEGAKKIAMEYMDIFEEGDFYIEIQDHGIEEQIEILPDLKKLGEELNLKLVATNDVHYVNAEDAKAHDALLCIQTGKTVADEDRMRFANDQFYFKTEKEMRNLFAAFPGACDSTMEIADKCDIEFDFTEKHLPDFESPEGYTNTEYLRKLCKDGLEERYFRNNSVSDIDRKELEERLEYELATIESMGFVEYFLITWDFINYAKVNGIVVGPGRGSAAGSIVAYVLKITGIDPIKYGLIFERFLNPERVSMPDIDIDFCYERRQEVIDYVIEKYGTEKVAQIITFGTLKAKAAIRDVGRVLNISYQETDQIAKAVPVTLDMTLEKALYMNPDLKNMYEVSENAKEIIDMAQDLEGMPRHASTHAAGVVISKENMDEYVPLYYSSDKGVATQFPMTTVEELGLLKMDFLGLRNLTVIKDAIDLISANHKVDIDLETMTFDDPKVFETIASGNTAGVFQLESGGMTSFMMNLKPDCFEDIVAGISLYRPGPMDSIPKYIENKKNTANITYTHKALEPIMSVSYGCLVYQEQVMQIVRDLAGYSYGRSDLVRRAMGKKKMDVMMQEKENFIYGVPEENIDGCIKRGIPKEAAEEIFNSMVSFAEYAFNKSHAAAYAVIGYQTAYLKTYYPVEFMAALMTSVMGDAVSIGKYIRNAKEMGIEVLPPDINESSLGFTAINGKIRFGLRAVKNVGINAINAIIESRKENGPSDSLSKFISQVDINKVNKKSVESLIKAGALDSINPNRAQSLAVFESLLESAQTSAKKNTPGQISMFQTHQEQMDEVSLEVTMPKIAPFTDQIMAEMEKEMLGVYITSHPLDRVAERLKSMASVTSEELHFAADELKEGRETTLKDKQKVTIAGIIDNINIRITRNNDKMAIMQIEDLTGIIEVLVFARTFAKCENALKEGNIIVIKGNLELRDDEMPKVFAQEISPFREEKQIIKLRLTEEGQFDRIKELISKHRGENEVIIYLPEGKVLKGSKEFAVEISKRFMEEAKEILREENVKVGVM